MKRSHWSFVMLLAGASLLSACNGQSNPFGGGGGDKGASEPAASSNAQQAAEQGLQTFRALVNAGNYAALGFAKADDVQRAQLAAPLAIRSIGLDALKRGETGDAAALLVDDKRSLYPLTVDGNVVSSLTVGGRDDGYRTTDFGNAAYAQLVSRYRQADGDFLVQVPALKTTFVARQNADGLLLTPTLDDPAYGWKAGEVLSAARVLPLLQKAAEAYNGLPQ